MKKVLSFALLLVLWLPLRAQTFSEYSMTVGHRDYISIASAANLMSNINGDGNGSLPAGWSSIGMIPLPFDFAFGDTVFSAHDDTLYIRADGYVFFRNWSNTSYHNPGNYYTQHSTLHCDLIAPFTVFDGQITASGANSGVYRSFEVSGGDTTAIIVEFKGLQRYNAANTNYNWQLRIYNDGSIEATIGQTTPYTEISGSEVHNILFCTYTDKFALTGSWSNPLFVDNGELTNLGNTLPASGTTFLFYRPDANCMRPSGLTVNNITANSAHIQWNGEGGTYILEVPEAEISTTLTDNFYDLTGLASGTNYSVRLSVLCENGDTSRASQTMFQTDILCYPVLNLRVGNVSFYSASLLWDYQEGRGIEPDGVTVTLHNNADGSDNTNDQVFTTSENYVFLTDLLPVTSYTATVQTSCQTETSPDISISFSTSSCDNVIDGTLSLGYTPFYTALAYSYHQILFTAEQVGLPVVNGISFKPMSAGNPPTRKIRVFMANTSLTGLSATNYIPYSDLQLVADSVDYNVGQADWCDLVFDTPFVSDGRNIVIAIHNISGVTTSFNWYGRDFPGGALFNSGTMDASTDISTVTSFSTTEFQPAIRFLSECEEITCLPPNVILTGTSTETIDIDWVAGTDETEWLVGCAPVGTTPDLISVSETGYSFSNLQANTAYTVRVGAVCDEDTLYSTLTVRTQCGDLTLPYNESFDLLEASAAPDCWHVIQNNGAYPYVYNSSSYAHSGSKSLYLYSSSSSPNLIASPAIDANPDDIKVTFWARQNSNAGDLEAGVLTSLADPSTFIPIISVSPAENGNTYRKYFFYTDNLNISQPFYIAFRKTGNSAAAYIDDITIGEAESCRDLDLLRVEGVTEDGATLTWRGHGDGQSYVVQLLGGDEYTTSDTSLVLTELLGATTYQATVWALCGAADSSQPATVSFRTMTTPYRDFPYHTGFESFDDDGWDIYNGSYNGWYIGSAVQNTGFNSLYISNDGGTTHSYSNGNQTASWASRMFFISDTGSYLINFDWMATGESGYDYLRVFLTPGTAEFQGGLMPDNITSTNTFQNRTPAGWINITTSALNSSNTWSNFERFIDITDTGYFNLVFVWVNDGSVGSNPPAAIDNVYFGRNTCPYPTNLSVTDFSDTEVTLSWTPGGSEETWAIYVNGEFAEEVTEIPAVVSELTGSTMYTFDVAAVCDAEDTSRIVSVSQLTLPTPIREFPYQTGFEEGEDVSWEFNNASNGWYIGSGASNGGSRAMYISNDGGATNSYSNSTTSFSYATRLFEISEPGDYEISFDWKANGESNYDFARAWVAPGNVTLPTNLLPNGNNSSSSYTSTTPAGWIDIANGKLNLHNSWQNLANVISFAETGIYSIVLMWANDGSVGEQTPMAVDNFYIGVLSCSAPAALTVDSVAPREIDIRWLGNSNASSYLVSVNGGDYEEVSDTVYVATELRPNTTYTFSVRTLCDSEDTSRAVTIAVTTLVSCPAPSSIVVDSIASREIDIHWTPAGEETTWLVSINGGDYEEVSESSYVATDLSPNTSYTFYVRAVCDDEDSSSVVSRTVTTLVSCPAPSGFGIDSVTTTEITFHWVAVGEETEWMVSFNGGAEEYVSGTPSYTATGLSGSTTYTVTIRAICDVDDTSAFLTGHATTACGDITTIPWSEGFETWEHSNTQTAFERPCWIFNHTRISSGVVYPYPNTVYHTGSTGLCCRAFAGHPLLIVLPSFEADISTLGLSLWARVATNNVVTLQLGYLPNPYDSTTFVPVYSQPNTVSVNSQHAQYSTNMPTEATGRLAIRLIVNSTSDQVMWIDDIEVYESDTTETPDQYYTVSATSANASMGSASVTPSGSLVAGTQVTATATPASGYVFTNWTVGGNVVSSSNPYTFSLVANTALVANFAAEVGIDNASASDISLFPNPATSEVVVSGVHAGDELTLVDLNGRTVGQFKAESSTVSIDLATVASGTYFVRVVSAEQVSVMKLVVR